MSVKDWIYLILFAGTVVVFLATIGFALYVVWRPSFLRLRAKFTKPNPNARVPDFMTNVELVEFTILGRTRLAGFTEGERVGPRVYFEASRKHADGGIHYAIDLINAPKGVAGQVRVIGWSYHTDADLRAARQRFLGALRELVSLNLIWGERPNALFVLAKSETRSSTGPDRIERSPRGAKVGPPDIRGPLAKEQISLEWVGPRYLVAGSVSMAPGFKTTETAANDGGSRYCLEARTAEGLGPYYHLVAVVFEKRGEDQFDPTCKVRVSVDVRAKDGEAVGSAGLQALEDVAMALRAGRQAMLDDMPTDSD